MFESIEIGDGTTAEAQFIVNFTGVTLKNVLQTLRTFERRGTIERFGEYIRLRPHPLALRLCTEWWRGANNELVNELLASVPESMIDSLCQRLSTLDFLEEARQVIAKLCEAKGPFANAEVLSSERGARTLRALTEVNPEACAEALCSTIQKFTLTELTKPSIPRRQWVWTLELMVFRHETFSKSIRALQRLAVSETENFSNNATGIWEQIFHVYLPGTEASLEERHEYLSSLLEQSEEESPQQLLVGAINKAFESVHFTRTSGAEEQGSGPALQEYEPKDGKEIQYYWNRILDIALQAVKKGRLNRRDLLPVFASRLRGLIISGAIELARKLVTTGREWSNGPWTGGIEALQDSLRFDARNNEPLSNVIKELLGTLQPQRSDIAGRIATIVTQPSWNELHEESETGKLIDVGEIRALEFGEECGREFGSIESHLQSLFSGEQRMAWAFGRGIARSIADPIKFVLLAENALLSAKERQPNPTALGGFLNELSITRRTSADFAIESILGIDELREFIPILLSGMKPTFKQLSSLIDLVKTQALSVASLRAFGYGRALDHLEPKKVAKFATELYEYSLEGAEVGFFVLYMHLFGHPERWDAIKSTMRQFIIAGKLTRLKRPSVSTNHEWGSICLKLLAENDAEVALSVSKQIVEMDDPMENRASITDVCSTLLGQYAKECWPIFGAVLLGPSNIKKWRLEHCLRREAHFDRMNERGPIDHLDQDILVDWLDANPEGAKVVAGMVAIINWKDDSPEWAQIARWLFNNSSSKEVLSSITSNLISGSWSGTRKPYITNLQCLLGTVFDHKSKNVGAWAKELYSYLGKELHQEERESNARIVGRW